MKCVGNQVVSYTDGLLFNVSKGCKAFSVKSD